MEIAQTVSSFTTVQQALNVISLLQLTSFRYPLQADVSDGASFDYIIVGGGTAGSVMANRLTEDPRVSVLLVEAGGDPPLESNLPGTSSYVVKSRIDWNYTANGCGFDCHLNNQMTVHKGKTLGGSSSINAMLYVRGNPHDYDTWARIAGDDTWRYENILQYFKKSERQTDPAILNSPTGKFHGTDGNLGVSTKKDSELEDYLGALKEIGYKVNVDTNSNDTLGYAQPQTTVADGIRQSTANGYLSAAKNRPNLYVLKNHLVTKINFQNKVAESIIAVDSNGNAKTFKAKLEIILSAGPINSPQLLMLSGIGPKKHLKDLNIDVIANLPVGENMQNHMFSALVYAMGDSKPAKPANPHEISKAIVGFGAIDKTQLYPDYQTVIMVLDNKNIFGICSVTYEFNDDICLSLYNRSKGKQIIFVGQMVLHPKTRGKVLLKSKDPSEYPLLFADAYNDEDIEAHVKYNKEFAPMINTTFFKSVGAKFLELEKCAHLGVGTDEYWRCHSRCMVGPTYHQVGTCSMGSVVDSRLLVKGVRRLRVVDSSVMPTITSGNTYATTVMIAEKATDMVKRANARKSSKA